MAWNLVCKTLICSGMRAVHSWAHMENPSASKIAGAGLGDRGIAIERAGFAVEMVRSTSSSPTLALVFVQPA